MTDQSTEIFISGGGVAGLTAAAHLGTRGFEVVVVDPAPPVTQIDDPSADLRTTALLQPARTLLEEAGVWPYLDQSAAPLQIMRIVDASQNDMVQRDFDAADISDQPFGWNVANWRLRGALVERLAELPNVDFRPGVGFGRMTARTTSSRVTLTDGTRLTAKLVIGADGRHSPVRKAAGIGVRMTRYGQTAITCAVTHDAPHDNISTEIHKSGGPFTLVPLPDHQGRPCSAIVWMDEVAETDAVMELDDAAFSKAATDRSAGVLGPLTLVTRRTTWPIMTQTADAFTAERTALMAEAAHVMPPIGAQGLNTSLKDLSTLADLIAKRPTDPGARGVLDAYARARAPDVRIRSAGISALNRTSMSGRPLIQSLRSAGVRAIHDTVPIRKALMALGLGQPRERT